MHVFGPVEETLAEVAHKRQCDLMVIGAWQKKMAKGFKHRVSPAKLHPILAIPLMIAP